MFQYIFYNEIMENNYLQDLSLKMFSSFIYVNLYQAFLEHFTSLFTSIKNT